MMNIFEQMMNEFEKWFDELAAKYGGGVVFFWFFYLYPMIILVVLGSIVYLFDYLLG
jgi:hypothetical protein